MNQIRKYIYSLDLNIYEFPFHHRIIPAIGLENDPKSHHRITPTLNPTIIRPYTHFRRTATSINTRRTQTHRTIRVINPPALTVNRPIRQSKPHRRPIREDNIIPRFHLISRRLHRPKLIRPTLNPTKPSIPTTSNR